MVFRLRRIDITLIENLAQSCEFFLLSEAKKKAAETTVQPMLFVANS
jgi:hypothetical protein